MQLSIPPRSSRREEALGRKLDRFIPERYRTAHRQHVVQYGHSGQTTRAMGRLGTLFGLRANGEEFPLESSISRVEVDGQTCFTAILRDITERFRAEEAHSRLATIPMLLMSGFVGAWAEKTVKTLGLGEVLVKPVNPDSMAQAVAQILSRAAVHL